MGWRREAREYNQSAYGGYCNYVREAGLTPMAYYQFVDVFAEVRAKGLTKKETKAAMIQVTRFKNDC
ncbi:hypothetical protein Goe27_00430 [Bacillus phage vB_BsuM-Goe27]|uniref:Uncharacterized protein n=1 Tax=Bacillus phage vB_BsuM-Goe3 TaxID=1933063 RepID=A0A217ER06_BPGO3|nr:hypothetical protein HWB07_gp041 [Bacillus phage vB_BsuM-Goe3]APZ82507.1 hypothetical protein Goe3_c04100 [Bacillus phage vB_BsuM-Goe3]WCS69926.1 hypothetical protein Goe27_00430 [Bacillus phage vB_BsuM-Goe27]